MRESSSSRRQFLSMHGIGELLVERDSASAAPSESALTAADGGERILNRFSTRAMASSFDVLVDGHAHPHGADAALAALDRIHQLESILSTYREDSPVSMINRMAAYTPVVVPAEVIELLRLACSIFQATGGAFDVTSGPLSKVWGFYYRQPRVPNSEAIAEALRSVGFQMVSWQESTCTVRLERPGVELNFASIGKGYALDQAAECLRAAAVDEALIQGGDSSVLARSPPDASRGWTIGVEHPLRPGVRLGTIELRNQALATSGSQRQSLIHGGERLGHVLDPRTGCPARHIVSATVVAPSAAEADAWATACCVLQVTEISALCRERPDLGAIVISIDPQNGQQLVVDVMGNRDVLRWTPAT